MYGLGKLAWAAGPVISSCAASAVQIKRCENQSRSNTDCPVDTRDVGCPFVFVSLLLDNE